MNPKHYSQQTRDDARATLRRALELWAINPARGAAALDAEGNEVATISVHACRYCALGALYRASAELFGCAGRVSDAIALAKRALAHVLVQRDDSIVCAASREPGETIAWFNDLDDEARRLSESDWCAAIAELGET